MGFNAPSTSVKHALLFNRDWIEQYETSWVNERRCSQEYRTLNIVHMSSMTKSEKLKAHRKEVKESKKHSPSKFTSQSEDGKEDISSVETSDFEASESEDGRCSKLYKKEGPEVVLKMSKGFRSVVHCRTYWLDNRWTVYDHMVVKNVNEMAKRMIVQIKLYILNHLITFILLVS